jgi:hypothetical protein
MQMHPRPRLQTTRARRRRNLSKQLMQMHPRPWLGGEQAGSLLGWQSARIQTTRPRKRLTLPKQL